jgi:competence protein ComEC
VSRQPAGRDGHPGRPAGRLTGLGLAGLALLAAIFAAGFEARPDGRIHISVLDVGQGDAILVEGDSGSRLLIDGGPDPNRLIVALDGRFPPWDRRIDVLILSHPHEDHAGGLPRLVQSYRIGQIYEPGMLGPGPAYRAFRGALALDGRTTGILSTGDRLQLDSIGLKVLWPDRDAVPRTAPDGGTSINNVSIVLLGTFGGQRFLLAGDIEQEIDPILVGRGLPRVDLLKVAHHGSRTSSTNAFLDQVRPSVAIVSVGAVNPYGHPAPETLARVEAHGARLYRTDKNGSVEATLDGRSVTVQVDRGGPAVPGAAVAGPAGATVAAASARRASSEALAFRCGIASPAFGSQSAPLDPGPVAAVPISDDGLYHRVDVHPDPTRGRGNPPFAQPIEARPAARPGGGRDRGLAGPQDRSAGHPDQPPRGRGRRPAPRRRQGPAQAPASGPSPPSAASR